MSRLFLPDREPIADSKDNLRITRPWLLFFNNLLAAIFGSLTGDVTSTSTGVTTISPHVVTFAKMQTIPSHTVLGRVAAGTGDISALTMTQVNSMGYWSELTDGDPTEPELIFDSFGNTIDFWVPTP